MTSPSVEQEMPFLDHLEELRWRLLKVIAALLVGVVAAFTLLSTKQVDLLNWMQWPVAPYLDGRQLVYTSPTDPLRITISAALGFGIVMAAPVIVYQIWAFLSPALYASERKVVIPTLFGATLLFFAGMALAFFFVLPVTLKFLLGFQAQAFAPMLTVTGYFDTVFSMCLAFGAAFELPIVLLLLTALGITNPEMLGKIRRYALIGCLSLAAVITPDGNPLSMLALAGPLYVLYEGGIILSRLVVRARRRREIAPESTPA